MHYEDLPQSIRDSEILTETDLQKLMVFNELPEIDPLFSNQKLTHIVLYFSIQPAEMEIELHLLAKELLDQGKTGDAWQVLLSLETGIA